MVLGSNGVEETEGAGGFGGVVASRGSDVWRDAVC